MTPEQRVEALKGLTDTKVYVETVIMQANETGEVDPAPVISQVLIELDFLATVLIAMLHGEEVDDG